MKSFRTCETFKPTIRRQAFTALQFWPPRTLFASEQAIVKRGSVPLPPIEPNLGYDLLARSPRATAWFKVYRLVGSSVERGGPPSETSQLGY